MDQAPITLCGSLSLHPVSLGAVMHRAAYAALGLPWTYVPFAVTDLRGALAGMRALGIRGFGVSMPFKLEIMPLLDHIAPMAASIGAVNTIVNDHGTLTGHNTDAYGAAAALEEKLPLGGARVVVIGGGGAARAVAHGLHARGAKLHVVNRTVAKAEAIAAQVGATVGTLADLARLDRFDAIVNASSAGMAGYELRSPVPPDAIESRHVVMDIVYKPVATQLLADATARGATGIHGGRMLLHQAVKQFELYTGLTAPRDVMDAALTRQIAGESSAA